MISKSEEIPTSKTPDMHQIINIAANLRFLNIKNRDSFYF